MRNRVLSLLMAGLMAATVFAGCNGGSKDSSNSAGNSSSETSSSEETEDDKGSDSSLESKETGTDSAGGGSFAGYPMENGEKISWWVGTGYILNEAYGNADESPFHSGLSEMTGVDIEWSFPTPGTDAAQAFNLLIAGGDYPDIIFSDKIIADAQRFMEENVVRDLSNEIEEYSPNYYKFLKGTEIYDKAMKTDEGQYYGYGFFREDGGWNDTYLGPVIRQDWLDALNLEKPKTISDWDKTIRAFKDEYGVPMSFTWEQRFRSHGIAGAFGAYGTSDFQLFIDDSEKVQFPQAQPEWRDYMEQLNTWWADGLIDQDILTMKDTEAQTKALNNQMGISFTSMGQLSNWEKDAEESGNGAVWIGLEYPTGDDGTLSSVFGGSGIGNTAAVITTQMDDSKLETAMRLLDYAYTDEGSLYWNFGKEGVSWEYNSENEVEYLPLVTDDPDGLNNAISKYGGSTWNGSCIQMTRMLYLKNTQTAIDANDLWYYPNEDVAFSWTYPRTVTFTTEESNRIDELKSQIDTHTKEMTVKFLTGEEPIENFDKFVETLNSMGLEEMLSIYQAAYDRYLGR